MKKMLVEQGIPPGVIFEEKRATSTYENFLFTKKIVADKKLTSTIIVTEPFHITRAALVAKKLGFTYSVSPAVDSPCWQEHTYLSPYTLKEPMAIVLYKLQGKL